MIFIELQRHSHMAFKGIIERITSLQSFINAFHIQYRFSMTISMKKVSDRESKHRIIFTNPMKGNRIIQKVMDTYGIYMIITR